MALQAAKVTCQASKISTSRPCVLPPSSSRRSILLGAAALVTKNLIDVQSAWAEESEAVRARKERLAAKKAEKEGRNAEGKGGEKKAKKEEPKGASKQDILMASKKERLAALKAKAARIRSGEEAPTF